MKGLFWAAYALWLGSEAWILQRDRAPAAGVQRDAGSRSVLIAAIVGSIVIAFMLARVRWAATPWSRAEAVPVGASLMLAGIAFRLWAVRTLGAHFRTQVMLLDAHRLVRTGPYARLRHPAYTGALLPCLGLGVSFANWLSLLAMIVGPLAGLAWRVRIEEHALGDRFGDEWRGYRAASWAIVPPIW